MRTKNINFRLDEDITHKLDEFAEKHYEGNRSLVIVKAIKDFLGIEDNLASANNDSVDGLRDEVTQLAEQFDLLQKSNDGLENDVQQLGHEVKQLSDSLQKLLEKVEQQKIQEKQVSK